MPFFPGYALFSSKYDMHHSVCSYRLQDVRRRMITNGRRRVNAGGMDEKTVQKAQEIAAC